MAVPRNLRTYPLSLKTGYTLNNGITSAFDFAGNPNNAYAGGDGVDHITGYAYGKDAGAVFPVVTVAPGILGRDLSQGGTLSQAYRKLYVGPLGFGSADGKGAFTVHQCLRAPAAKGSTAVRLMAAYNDGTGSKIDLYAISVDDTSCVFQWSCSNTLVPPSTARANVEFRVPYNSIVRLYLVRANGMLSFYLNGQFAYSVAEKETYTVFNGTWTGATSGSLLGVTSTPPLDVVMIDQVHWNRALSADEVLQHYNDPYGGYNNTAVVTNGVKITSPLANATVSSEGFTIAGTYTGTAPTSIQARFDGGTWATIVSNPTGGSFTGNFVPGSAKTGLLEIRSGTSTTIVDSVTITTQLPLPTVSIVSQGPVSGQSLPFQVSVQRADSLRIELVAAGNGAITTAHTIPTTYSASAATIPDNFADISPGDYTVKITATNATGPTTINGAAFTIAVPGGGGGTPPPATVPVRFDFPASYDVLAPVVETPSTITGVTISPTAITLSGGATQAFTGTATGDAGADLSLTWTASGGTVSQSGSYNAPAATTSDQVIKVRATSVQDPTKWAEATVTILALPTVTGVAVTPLGVVLAGGASFKFDANVLGINNPAQGVTWDTTLGEVDAAGTVVAPYIIGEDQDGTVTATSTADPTVSGSVQFTVLGINITPDPGMEPAARFARPIRDISRGNWQPSSGSDLWAMVDDPGNSDGDFISTSGAAPCELLLGPVRDPNTSENQVIRYEAYSPSGGPMTVELRQGALLIASWTHASLPTTMTQFAQTLTGAQCDSITDYTDLRIKLVGA